MYLAFSSKAQVTAYLYCSGHLKYLKAFSSFRKLKTRSFLFLRAPKHFKVGKQILKYTYGLHRCKFQVNAFSLHSSKPQLVTFSTLLSLLKVYGGYGVYLKHCKLAYSLRIKF